MKTKLFNLSTIAFVATSLFSSNLMAKDLDEKRLKNIKRDLRIMTTIVKTAVSDVTKNDNHIQVNSTYMANQGMMFSFSLGHGYSFMFSTLNAPMPPVAPLAKLPEVNVKVLTPEIVEEISEATMENVEVAMEIAEAQIEFYDDVEWYQYSGGNRNEFRHEQSELRRESRELEREAREIERKVRVIERKIRDAEYSDELREQEKNKQKVAALESEMKTLTESLQGVSDKIIIKAKSLKEKAEKAKQKQMKLQQEQLQQLEVSLSQAVCDFGAGLRSLAKDEHITFNIRGKSNRMYVFDKPTIEKCADGDIDSSELLKRAVTYQL